MAALQASRRVLGLLQAALSLLLTLLLSHHITLQHYPRWVMQHVLCCQHLCYWDVGKSRLVKSMYYFATPQSCHRDLGLFLLHETAMQVSKETKLCIARLVPLLYAFQQQPQVATVRNEL